MKTYILLSVILGIFAASSDGSTIQNSTTTKSIVLDIDEDALKAFSLLLIQNQANSKEITKAFFPIYKKSNLQPEECFLLLALGGIDVDFAGIIINKILPVLKAQKKSTEETVMTLTFISNVVCKEGKDFKKHCPKEAEMIMRLIMSKNEFGCDGKDMLSFTNTKKAGESCVCKEQDNALFWINLFEIYKSNSANSTKTNLFPAAFIRMTMNTPCSGYLNVSNTDCYCSKVTRGYDAMFMQYILTSEDMQKQLSPKIRDEIRATYGNPQTRIFGNTNNNANDYLFSILAQNGNYPPQVLSLLQSQGSLDLRQLLLAGLGLETNLAQIILFGGFENTPERISMINYLASLGTFDTSLIPLLLNVPNGKDFFITSLLESGAIDPTTGILLLGMQSGLSNTEVLDLLISTITAAQNNPDFYQNIGKPYVPVLPEGIYPGSKLFFPHFETLGINTCALHDLRNRFECGYLGITAAQCETVPYCCYNPLFISDEQVRNATNNAITTVTAVPWCYYNIFFIYYDSFYLPVKRPGQFASPLQCSGLFKYGLQIDSSLYTLIEQTTNNALSRLINPRTECGFPGMTEFHCVAVRGCCWDKNPGFRVSQCYQPSSPNPLTINYESLPAAYRPVNGSCNTNPYKLPVLYYLRTACHYQIDFLKYGYNLLATPNQFDCLTKLGCCWESDDAVIKQYSYTPRCYQRVNGADKPSIIPDISALFRSGGSKGSDFRDVLPPVKKG